MNRWIGYFEKLLNRSVPREHSAPPTPLPIFKDIQPSYMVLDVNNKKPSKEEIIKAMKLLKGEKAAGQDSIQANRLLEPVF